MKLADEREKFVRSSSFEKWLIKNEWAFEFQSFTKPTYYLQSQNLQKLAII